MKDKELLRKFAKFLIKKKSNDSNSKLKDSINLWSKVSKIKNWDKMKNIGFYASMKNEVNTWDILENIWENKSKRIFLPRVLNNDKGLEYIQIDKKAELVKNDKFPKILEPPLNGFRITPDIIFVPGLLFDIDGKRLGRGGGFYDRYLNWIHKNYKNIDIEKIPLIVGVAFDYQIMNIYNNSDLEEFKKFNNNSDINIPLSIPEEKHDVCVDFILTPSKLYECKK